MSAFEGKADMTFSRESAFAVAIGGKADMPFCTAYVRYWPKADIVEFGALRGKTDMAIALSRSDVRPPH